MTDSLTRRTTGGPAGSAADSVQAGTPADAGPAADAAPAAEPKPLSESVASALVVDAVTAGYGGTTVLREVSLEVRPGEVLALLGSNGAGKTTTLRTIGGLVRPSAGRLLLNGATITQWPPHRRAKAGLCLISEGRGIFRTLTVRENLRLHVSGSGKPAQGFESALEVFPFLSSRLNEIAGRLSGGQQQMLALARAYLTSPKVILLDELSMGLAPRTVDQLFEALQQLATTGVAMVLVEQYVTRAMAMADTVVLLRKGVVTFHGPPAELDEEQVVQGYLGAGHQAATEG